MVCLAGVMVESPLCLWQQNILKILRIWFWSVPMLMLVNKMLRFTEVSESFNCQVSVNAELRVAEDLSV